jgi:hypothetical protein
VKIQSESQLLQLAVADADCRCLGRVVAVDCSPDPHTAAWFVLRLPGWPRRLRAVLAQHAQAPAPACRVPYHRAQVLASPALTADRLDTGSSAGVEAFYSSPDRMSGAAR